MNNVDFKKYTHYKNTSFINRRFNHKLVSEEISRLKSCNIFEISEIGHSIENREIYCIKYGKGKTSILFWSQMHGNEATATAALFDLFNFFITNDEFNEFRKLISENFTLHFIPMLNPDGAERFQRENALNVDLNRDALKKSMPETNILWNYRNKINPSIGFNLHDQRSHYNVSGTSETASMSFLAPAFNQSKDLNDNRQFAMKCIVALNKYASQIIPGKIARYNDTFGERCVGDQFQGLGMSTILIESGALKDDTERQMVRQLNGYTMLNFLIDLANEKIDKINYLEYEDIPENDEKLFDILLRNVSIITSDKTYQTDIGIRFNEYTNYLDRTLTIESYIEEIGDLSNYYGISEFDADGYQCKFGKIVDIEMENKNIKAGSNHLDLIKNRYTAVFGFKSDTLRTISKLPFHFSLESAMDFVFFKNKKAEVAVVNDKIINLKNEINHD